MKNWIKFFTIFLLILSLSIVVIVAWKSYSPFYSSEKDAKQVVLDADKLVTVTDTYVYNGKKPYVTVIGTDKAGKKKAVFVPKDDSKAKLEEVIMENGTSEKEALSVVSKKDNVKEILHTKLGIEEPGVVWEITYLNQEDKLNYVYILFENGQWWKRILNL